MAYRGFVPSFPANWWLPLAQSAVVLRADKARPHSASWLASWLFLAIATLAGGFSSLSAVDTTVNLTSTSIQAYEADPLRYGVLQITRSSAIERQDVRIDITPGFAALNINYTLNLDQVSVSAAAGFALSSLGQYGNAFIVTFPIGVSSIWVDVVALDDNKFNLGLIAKFELLAGQTGVVVGGSQVVGIEIIDLAITLQTVVLNPYIRESIPADLNNVAQNRNFGEAQLLFNSKFAPFRSRHVEAQISGSATLNKDYIVTYRIGSSRVANTIGAVKFPQIPVFKAAYRRSTEYGAGNLYANPMITEDGLIIAGDSPVPPYPGGIARTTTLSFAVDAFTNPTNGDETNMVVDGFSVPKGKWIETQLADGRIKITITDPTLGIPLPLAQGAVVQFNWIVTVPGTGGSGPTPLNTPVKTKVNEPVLYTAGATSVSVASNSGLQVGDLFEINGELKRAIYVGGSPPDTADAGKADTWVAFSPPLVAALLRTSNLVLTTHWQANFDSAGQRMSWYIPALYPTVKELRRPAGIAAPATLVDSNIPLGDNGDHIDLFFTPLDDNIIEGEESVILTTITTGSSNGYTIQDPQVAYFRVGDNDVTASIEALADPQVPQVNGAIRMKLSSPFPGLNVTIPYSISKRAGDATFGLDYVIDGASADSAGNVTGKVIIVAGATSIIVPIRLLRTTPVGAALPIRVSLQDSFDYVLAGASGGNAGSNAATVSISNRSNVIPVLPDTPVVPDVSNSTESNGSGCGAGSGMAFVLLGAWLALARFRLRNR